jgi:hypothetical protein
VPTNIGSELKTVDNLLYVGTHSGTYVFDLTDIANPQQVGQYANLQLNHINVDENVAYLFSQLCGWEPTGDGGVSGGCSYIIEVVDFTNLAQPEFEGRLCLTLRTNQECVESTAIQGQLIYFETRDTLYVLDISELEK